MNIMLAEDSGTMRGVIRTMLNRLGEQNVPEASNGREAWEQMHGEQFDLLLTDWNIPQMSGLELLQKVRQDSRMTDLPVIMLTSRNSKEDIVSALRQGINGYIIKPCKPSQLKAKIYSVMAASRKEADSPLRLAQQVVANSRKRRSASFCPNVLCYAAPADYKEFIEGKSRDLAVTYEAIAATLERLNAELPGMELSYQIEHDSKEFTRLVDT